MKKILIIILMVFTAGSAFTEPPPQNDLEKRIDSLFIIASSGDIKYRDSVDQAIDSIAAIGAAAVPRLVEKYTTQSARERVTINMILKKIGSDGVPYLTKSLALSDPEQVSRICYSLGEIKDKYATKAILKVLHHDNWWVRSSCAGALGKISDTLAYKDVLSLFNDSVETVRKSAVVAVGDMEMEEAIPQLIHMLGDPYYGVRMTASEALEKFGEKAIPYLADSLSSDNDLVVNLDITTLGHIGGDKAAEVVSDQTESPDPIRRALAVEAIYDSGSSLECGLVEQMKETETDPTVLYYIDLVLEKYAAR